MRPKAVVLLSGGLDSAVVLFHAAKNGYDCHCLAFDYAQRHRKELGQAEKIAACAGAAFRVVKLDLPWKASSLLDKKMKLPLDRTIGRIRSGIPSSYVPARNTAFLSLAASFAEAIEADAVFIGAHFDDSSGYPDCGRQYLEAFRHLVKIGTKRGLEGHLDIKYPLAGMTKGDIIKMGKSLGVPFHLTWSCYQGGRRPCARCDSCILRQKAFREAGMKDPLYEH